MDISTAALALATDAVASVEMDDRISFVQANVCELEPRDEFEEVDLVTCFLMGHDLWPRSSCIDALQKLRKAFPNVENFVLCDTWKADDMPRPDPSLFTPGFELAHAVMGVNLPTLSDWLGVFKDGGWRCVEQRDIPTPAYTSMFVLQPI